jgi:hypothetical protein
MGTNKQIACFDIEKREWLIYKSAKEAALIMGMRNTAPGVAKLQKTLYSGRYFFCDPVDIELYTEETILDPAKRRKAKPSKSTCEIKIAIYDIRNANKGWQIHDSLKKAAKSIDMALSTLNKAVRDNELYKERYIIAYEGEHLKLDIPKILELPLEDNRYYIFPHTQEEREELYKRLEIGKYNKRNTPEALKELMDWANQQAEEANENMRRKIDEKMFERYGSRSVVIAAKMKKEKEEDELDNFDEDEPLGEDEWEE